MKQPREPKHIELRRRVVIRAYQRQTLSADEDYEIVIRGDESARVKRCSTPTAQGSYRIPIGRLISRDTWEPTGDSINNTEREEWADAIRLNPALPPELVPGYHPLDITYTAFDPDNDQDAGRDDQDGASDRRGVATVDDLNRGDWDAPAQRTR